ncbi:serine/threonine protein kinase [Mycolicibacterium farcinogenes]|uniref:Protein kinase n=1 Tax=Mycolicibacterium senegalense TaxID=1796 RepID=A0A378W7G3_9MYCO|nr:serine/threonine protein kinase [Mycolicibacterium farcinogenes]SUA29027.1 protein kinase [Mycolicibacterium senegalense]
MLAVGVPAASAAPSSDARGYVDSTARCATADATVLFGSTDASRVAICSVSGGKYEYRGVWLRDGAKLIVPATRNDDGAFRVENAGIEYLVTSKSLVLSVGEKVLREEAMVDFHRPGAPAPAAASPTPTTPLPPPLAAEVGGSGVRR